MRSNYWGALAIIAAAMLWATDGVFLTPTLYHLDVLAVVFALHALGLVLLTAFLKRTSKELGTLDAKRWTATLFVGLLGGLAGTWAITKAIFLVYTHGANISVILLLQKLQPVFAVALAAILLRERPTRKYFLWAAMAIAGSYLLTFGLGKPELALSNPTVLAALLAIIAAASWGSATTIGKYAFQRVTFLAGTFLRYLTTTLLAGTLLLLLGKAPTLRQFTPTNWLFVAIIVLTTGVGAMLIYYWGLRRVKASAATIYELAMPVTALVLEYLLTGKTITWAQGLGAAVLTGAILLLVREKNAFRHIIGTVGGGKDEGAAYVQLYAHAIEQHVGFTPYPGTLNLNVREAIKPRVLHTINGFVKDGVTYGSVDYTPATINGHSCAILLPRKSMHKKTIELIAKEKLREELGLSDGDEVEVEY